MATLWLKPSLSGAAEWEKLNNPPLYRSAPAHETGREFIGRRKCYISYGWKAEKKSVK
jgi:hypothetical protein